MQTSAIKNSCSRRTCISLCNTFYAIMYIIMDCITSREYLGMEGGSSRGRRRREACCVVVA